MSLIESYTDDIVSDWDRRGMYRGAVAPKGVI